MAWHAVEFGMHHPSADTETILSLWRPLQAAGVIHSDFERGFIMAETMAYDDLKEHGSEAGVKAAGTMLVVGLVPVPLAEESLAVRGLTAASPSLGKYRMQGKDYVVQDGDVFHFKFNVSPSAKKAK